jgi:hypothetical protein
MPVINLKVSIMLKELNRASSETVFILAREAIEEDMQLTNVQAGRALMRYK